VWLVLLSHSIFHFNSSKNAKDNMQYSDQKPTEPGWYWCYNPADHSEFVCRVDRLGVMLTCSWMTAVGQAAMSFEHEWSKDVQWCGPLPSPEGRKEPNVNLVRIIGLYRQSPADIDVRKCDKVARSREMQPWTNVKIKMPKMPRTINDEL
jgi:hypothetical protein